MNERVRWIDLSMYQAKLTGIMMPDGKKRLVITGLKPFGPYWERTTQVLGFVRSKSGVALLSDNIQITLKQFRQVFPLAKVVTVDKAEVLKAHRPEKPESVQDDVALRTAVPLGLNCHGQQVFEGEAGRFIKAKEGASILHEREAIVSAHYLRCDGTPLSIAMCADGFVLEMAAGQHKRVADLKAFTGTIWGLTKIENTDSRLRMAQEAVEAAIQRRLAATVVHPDDKAFGLAVRLHEAQPNFVFRTSDSVRLQQFSTPLPLAIAAQRLLGDVTGKVVLEPTIGNGSMITGIYRHASKAVGVDLAPERVAQAGLLDASVELVHGDATSADFVHLCGGLPECVIGNPPFGGLDRQQSHEGLRVTRIDQLIILRALAARADHGRGPR